MFISCVNYRLHTGVITTGAGDLYITYTTLVYKLGYERVREREWEGESEKDIEREGRERERENEKDNVIETYTGLREIQVREIKKSKRER